MICWKEEKFYPPIDYCVDAKAAFDAISASDACELAESSLKLHPISVRDRMTHGLTRRLYWVDARDMLADGLTKGGIDRELLHRCSNDCRYVAKREFEPHSKVFLGSATKSLALEDSKEELLDEEDAVWAPGRRELQT